MKTSFKNSFVYCIDKLNIIKKLFKITFRLFALIIIIIVLGSIFSNDDNSCYFKNGSSYDRLLIGNAVSNSVIKYAKYEGGTSIGVVTELTEINDSIATVIVQATLTAKNAFGVRKNTLYNIKVTLSCDGYSVDEINQL